MPGWHKDTRQAVDDGKLLVADIAPPNWSVHPEVLRHDIDYEIKAWTE